MSELTAEGARAIEDIATRHSVSADAVRTLVHALIRGGGRQAQFNHPELGGMGQWSQGGMTMVGDMFNTWLQAKVDALCQEISGHLARIPFFQPESEPSGWQGQSQGSGAGGVSYAFGMSLGRSAWPAELGSPASSGAQNELRYAIFPDKRRLAIAHPGGTTVYDTGDHLITGVSQQQSGGQSLAFTSQHGLVRVDDLPIVEGSVEATARPSAPDGHGALPADGEAEQGAGSPPEAPGPPAALDSAFVPPSQRSAAAPTAFAQSAPRTGAIPNEAEAVFAALERLAELHERGVVTDDEFSSKKADLLSRI